MALDQNDLEIERYSNRQGSRVVVRHLPSGLEQECKEYRSVTMNTMKAMGLLEQRVKEL